MHRRVQGLVVSHQRRPIRSVVRRSPSGRNDAEFSVGVLRLLFERPHCNHHSRDLTAIRGRNDAELSVAVLRLLFEWPLCNFSRIPILPYEYYVIGETKTFRSRNYLSFLPWENVAIRAYRDDLLLVSRVNGGSGRLSLCVCNPMTKKYWCGIPDPPGFNPGPFKMVFTSRRGENRVDHIYYVTIFFNYFHVGNMWTTNFSSETGQWSSPTMVRLPDDNYTTLANLLFNEPVTYGDGLVYWLGGNLPLWEWVIAFDPSAAASPDGHRDFRVIQLPPEASEYPSILAACLGTYRGRLCAAYINNASALRVWELNHTSCWSLVHDAALGLRIRGCIRPLALHPGDRNVVLLKIYTDEILQYDMSSRTSQTLGHIPNYSCPFSVYPLCSIWPTSVPSVKLM